MLSIHLRLRHDARDTARSAGSSAIVETHYVLMLILLFALVVNLECMTKAVVITYSNYKQILIHAC